MKEKHLNREGKKKLRCVSAYIFFNLVGLTTVVVSVLSFTI